MSDAASTTVEEVQRLWRSLVKLFPTWSLPFDWVLSPSSWRMIGVDMIAGQVHDPRVRRASALLGGATEEMVASLSQMARLNAERAANVFRAVAVCYVTLPIALAALLSEAAPGELRAYVEANVDAIAPWVVALIVTPVIYFCGLWRAKQIAWAIDLHCAGGVAPLAPKKR